MPTKYMVNVHSRSILIFPCHSRLNSTGGLLSYLGSMSCPSLNPICILEIARPVASSLCDKVDNIFHIRGNRSDGTIIKRNCELLAR